jgi:hypothetical protein
MTDYSKLFYWVSVADNATTLFGWMVVLFTIISLVVTIIFFVGMFDEDFSDTEKENGLTPRQEFINWMRKWLFWSYPFMILFWMLYVLTPDKKQSLLIIAGGGVLNYLTTDSIARQIPHELTDYVVTELKSMAMDVKVDLGIQTEKEKVLESVKGLSADELIEKMKNDNNLAKIILDKDK